MDPARFAHVDHLCGVLLEMGSVDANIAQPAVDCQGFVVLADLVALRQVGIEVVLAVEDRPGRDVALERRRDHQGVADRMLVDRRQTAGMPETDRTCVDIWLVAEGGGTAAEHLRLGGGLHVYLECAHGPPEFTGRTGGSPRIVCSHRPHPLTVASSAPK